jgi:hypothetical protein
MRVDKATGADTSDGAVGVDLLERDDTLDAAGGDVEVLGDSAYGTGDVSPRSSAPGTCRWSNPGQRNPPFPAVWTSRSSPWTRQVGQRPARPGSPAPSPRPEP